MIRERIRRKQPPLNGTSELPLTRSTDGRYLLLAGYGASAGYGSVVASDAATVARVVGVIGADGSIDTSTSLGSAFSATRSSLLTPSPL